MYTPDLWTIVKLTDGDRTNYRVLGSWYGGYLGGDSWRMSSGIVDYEDHEDHFAFFNYSGSVYICSKKAVGLSSLAYTALDSVRNTYTRSGQIPENTPQLEVIDVETFFSVFEKEAHHETKNPPSA
jgi:hypothetical protein